MCKLLLDQYYMVQYYTEGFGVLKWKFPQTLKHVTGVVLTWNYSTADINSSVKSVNLQALVEVQFEYYASLSQLKRCRNCC